MLTHSLDAKQRVAQLHEVHLAERGEQGAHAAHLFGVLRVTLEDVEASAEEPEVACAPPDRAVELGVVALTLLPARRDQGDRAVDAEAAELARNRLGAGRPEQDGNAHEAWTLRICPTESSMARSVS